MKLYTIIIFIITILSFNNLYGQLTFSQFKEGNCTFAKYRCTPSNFTSSNFRLNQPIGVGSGCFPNNVLVINNINWFYFEVSGSGTLNLNLNSSGNDVDYVCWGPFTSSQVRDACLNQVATQTPSYCGINSGNETINLTGVSTGQFYIVLTRSSVSGASISFTKASGTANVSCSQLSRCGNVDFDATEGSFNGTNIGDSKSYTCGTNQTLHLKAHGYNEAREFITPAMLSYTILNQRTSGNYISPIGIPSNYYCSQVTSYSTPSLTMHYSYHIEYMSPSQGSSLGFQYCDTYAGASSENMNYVIYDVASENIITNGTWNVVGGGTGPDCASDNGGSDCQDVTYSANSLTGNSSYSCSSCGTALTSNDDGYGWLNIAALPVGTHNIIYNWNDSQGCSVSKTKTITITGAGNPNFSYAQSTYCAGQSNPTPTQSSTLGNYSSTPVGLSINNTTGAINIGSSTPGSYTITKTIGSGLCAANHTENISIGGVNANAGSNLSLNCTNSSGTLNGSGGGTYSWSPSTGLSATNISSPTASPTSTTTYTLTVTGSNGCTDTDQTTVNVNNTTPTANAGSNKTINCSTTSVTLDGSGGGTYSWSPATGLSATNVSTPTATPTSTTTYTLTVTSSNGCTDTDQVTVTVDNTLPTANAGADMVFNCSVSSLTLDGTSSSGTGISYAWTGGTITSGATTATPQISASGTYTLTITGSNGCTDTDQVTITPDLNVPNANAGADVSITCTNTSVLLDGSSSDSGSNITYSWATSDGNIVGNSSSNTITADQDGTYTITVSNTSNGCSSTDNVIVTQDTITPIISFAQDTLTLTCNTTSIAIDASSSTGVGNTYNWTTSNGNFVSGQNTATPIVNSGGEYNLSITSSNGCTNINSAFAVVQMDTTPPTISVLPPDTLHCNLDSTTIDVSASNANNYSWTTSNGNIINGSNNSILIVSSEGDYNLTATGTNGCSSSLSIPVILAPNPTAIINASPLSGETPVNASFDGNNSLGNSLTYNWELNATNISNDSAFYYTLDEIGDNIISLIVTDINGCIDTSNITIVVNEVSTIFIPNVFTPNGDNENEYFVIDNLDLYPNNSIVIFNRWGDKVFEAKPYINNWNGKNTIGGIKPIGEDLVEGTYFYILYLSPNEKGINGTIELIKD